MISNLDKWEAKYIQNLKDKESIAWDDEEAYLRYPKWNFIYDKQILSNMAINTPKTWDLTLETPTTYPVYVKPRTNFYGLGKDSYVACSWDEIEDPLNSIAQQFLEGTHYSTDYVLKDGQIIDSWTFIGHKSFYNDFTLWESYPFPDAIRGDVEDLLWGYTGIANFESIGGVIIEGHLRGSLQFYDISGGMLSKMPQFVNTGTYSPGKFKKTYSKVLRTKHSGKIEFSRVPYKPKGVTSVQLCYEPGVPLNVTDPGAFRHRYAVINGTNKKIIDSYAKNLRKFLIFK